MPHLTGGRFEFGTKAQTLERLRQRISAPVFCKQEVLSVGEWRADRSAIIARCLRTFGAMELVVRSSAMNEDHSDSSMAGVFRSVIGVSPSAETISESIEAVIASYGPNPDNENQVLIQPRIIDIALAGVIVTRDIENGAPYYIINYDDMTGQTDSVTSGGVSKTIMVHRSRVDAVRSWRILGLIRVVQEIEAETENDRLDIEFCITNSGALYIVQVRPLATHKSWPYVANQKIDAAIDDIRQDIGRSVGPQAGILGSSTIFGQMPDWNPAEMLGGMPKPLAYSLYEMLITNDAWGEARFRMGYRDLRRTPLMVAFAGQPYIDVRLSFNSFLPATLDPAIGEKLVKAHIVRLAENPDLHDKIEFEIAFPSFDFRFDLRKEELIRAGLTNSEIDIYRAEVLSHTLQLIGLWPKSLENIEERLALLDQTRKRTLVLTPIEAI